MDDLTTGLAIVGAVSAALTILEKVYTYGSAVVKKSRARLLKTPPTTY